MADQFHINLVKIIVPSSPPQLTLPQLKGKKFKEKEIFEYIQIQKMKHLHTPFHQEQDKTRLSFQGPQESNQQKPVKLQLSIMTKTCQLDRTC